MSHVLLSCVGVVLNNSSGMAMAVDRDVALAARAGIPSESGVVYLKTSFVYFNLCLFEAWSLSIYVAIVQCMV